MTKHVVALNTMAETFENPPFGDHGDSGSVVYDFHGQAMVLLFTGRSPQQTVNAHTFVTPLGATFENIKELSKRTVTNIRLTN